METRPPKSEPWSHGTTCHNSQQLVLHRFRTYIYKTSRTSRCPVISGSFVIITTGDPKSLCYHNVLRTIHSGGFGTRGHSLSSTFFDRSGSGDFHGCQTLFLSSVTVVKCRYYTVIRRKGKNGTPINKPFYYLFPQYILTFFIFQ